MGVVRIDDELLKKVKEWMKKSENKYRYSSASAFINRAVYEKLKRLKNGEEK